MLQREHSAILSTFIKLHFVIKIFVLSFFEWLLKTGFTVTVILNLINCDQNQDNIVVPLFGAAYATFYFPSFSKKRSSY